MTLSEKIVDRWVANGRQKKELALVTGLHPTEISAHGDGRRQFSLERAGLVAAACGMKVGQFLTHIEEGTWPSPAE